jgi:hypothetical protein
VARLARACGVAPASSRSTGASVGGHIHEMGVIYGQVVKAVRSTLRDPGDRFGLRSACEPPRLPRSHDSECPPLPARCSAVCPEWQETLSRRRLVNCRQIHGEPALHDNAVVSPLLGPRLGLLEQFRSGFSTERRFQNSRQPFLSLGIPSRIMLSYYLFGVPQWFSNIAHDDAGAFQQDARKRVATMPHAAMGLARPGGYSTRRHCDEVGLWPIFEGILQNPREPRLALRNPRSVMLPDHLLGIAQQFGHIPDRHAGAL